MPTVNYSHQLPYLLNRPHATVQLLNGGLRTTFSFGNCLVDTGADHTVLPVAAAVAVGIVLPPSLTTIGTMGGPASFYAVPNCTVEIEAIVVSGITVLFDSSGRAPTVVGRDVLMALSEFGFNTYEWLWL
jgi:predicted aspartyl protease